MRITAGMQQDLRQLAAAAEDRPELLEPIERMQGQLVSLRSWLAQRVKDAERELEAWSCPHCGIGTSGPRGLDEHVHRIHGGPEPSHWSAE